MTANMWMVRAGDGGKFFSNFVDGGFVAIGWKVGDLQNISSREAMKERYKEHYPGANPYQVGRSAGMIYNFLHEIKIGEWVVAYDSAESREYAIGEVTGEYQYAGADTPHKHRRAVNWKHRVGRDSLSPQARKNLGGLQTVFSIADDTAAELLGGSLVQPDDDVAPAASEAQDDSQTAEEMKETARDFVRDKILKLSDGDMERLTAVVLRAMGYKTKVSPTGPDDNVDVRASKDALGMSETRIKVEVKHRKAKSDGPEIRQFLGALREGDRALYVSTGGYTKDAKKEADRANHPVTLVDLDWLIDLIEEYYGNFDDEGRALLPLVRLYWPKG